jgi:molybdate transport system substrate-binding protein
VKYAENSLAIMVPAGNPAGVKTIEDLVKPEVKTITIPDPEINSVGKHAVEALKNADVWDEVESKVLFARFAADSKDTAAKGQAEASIGYYPCAVEVHEPGQPPTQPKKLKAISQIPADLYPPFSCEGAVLKEAKNADAGKSLLAFLQTPQSQEIFTHWQFVASGAPRPVEPEEQAPVE